MPRSLYGKLHRRFGLKLSGREIHARSLAKRAAIEKWLAPRPKRSLREPIKVLIVGGGFAGLAAAWRLMNQYAGSFDVTVLEARKRVGGRVLSLSDHPPGRIIEQGAELIGMNQPAWLTLAQELGLGLSVLTSEDQFSAAGLEMPLRLGDGNLSPDAAGNIYDQMTDVLNWMGADAKQLPSAYEPWTLTEKAKTWDGMSVAQWLEKKLAKGTDLWKALEVQLVNDNLLPLEEQSYLGLLALIKGGSFGPDINAYWTASEVYRCEKGNQALATALQGKLGSRVQTNREVTSIELNEKGVIVQVKGQPSYQGKYVILAIPPSLWKGASGTSGLQHLVTVTQGKQPYDLKPYEMKTGPAIKYLSPVDKRFWISKNEAPSGMSYDLGMVWEGTDNQMEVEGQQLELSVFAGGRWATQALNQADGSVDPGGTKGTKPYFDKRLEQLYPGYMEASKKGGAYFANWPQDDFARCGYSCPGVGQVCTVGANLNQALNDTAGKPRLFFAGEHVCMAYFGYMEGALQSGWTAAQRIAIAEGLASGSPYPPRE